MLVTGGAGRIGRHVVTHLANEGHEVTSWDLTHLDTRERPDKIASFTGNILDSPSLNRLIARTDAIVHLAGLPSPLRFESDLLFRVNVMGTYNVLARAVDLGITRLCLASSINAIGSAYSKQPHYDYFPLDERHPSYVEDTYGLSKWLGEQMAEAAARRNPELSISSLRLHFAVEDRAEAITARTRQGEIVHKHLWGYVRYDAISRGVSLAIGLGIPGHQVYNLVAPDTVEDIPTRLLIEKWYPNVLMKRPLNGRAGLFDTTKAEQMLGWNHESANKSETGDD